MKKITLVDYIGNCDEKGEVTGHASKTLHETEEMLNEDYDVSMVLTPPYARLFEKEKISCILPYESSPQRQGTKLKKISLYLKKAKAVHELVKHEQEIWFVNTDFWLYVGLLFSRKKKGQKIFATNYLDFYSKKNLKNFIYDCAARKIDCVFHTNTKLKRENHQYIPGYWFDEQKYFKYIGEEKQEDVYICGGINAGKDIIGAIDAFNANGQPLIICGKFSSQDMYEKVIHRANKNIEIENVRLDDDTYYKELAKHKFVLLPYKEENYSNRSSGVVLESIFLGNIVIAPRFLLDQLEIAGIEYESIQELRNFSISNISQKKMQKIKESNILLCEKYDYNNVRKTYLNNL